EDAESHARGDGIRNQKENDRIEIAFHAFCITKGTFHMAEMLFTFASYATRMEGSLTPLKGMKRLADTLHPYGIKITWLVNHDSAEVLTNELSEWHDRFGDDVAVMVPHFKGGAPELVAQARATRQRMQKILPWTRADIAANHVRNRESLESLEAAGFIGLWGFCWEQIEVDDITDRGCPWGFYYLDPAFRTAPNTRPKGLIGMEWTARDLLKSFHSGNPCLYSTDPNDVGRGGLCSWEDIAYWERMAENYARNTRYNDHVFLLQHQEAHEMERTLCQCYTDEDIREASVMLDRFAAYLKGRASMMTLPEAAALYRERYNHTASSYMLWEDTPTKPYNPDYAWSTPVGPWPKTFLYYDRGAQMMFIEGKVEPVCIRNYARPYVYGEFFAEPDIPRTRLAHDTRFGWNRDIEILVNSNRSMPYGLALWKDYSLYQIAEAPGLVEGKILPRELLFLRYELQAGENRFHVKLQGK
ncbi:MAG TPA: hypothetical protein PKO36_05920, partial [Candidatus Hydrogenedentes bacterium]|nr:hypothetical protein [Candidatus Hydrogenedentota bacterium]